jgi:hypothetical protein
MNKKKIKSIIEKAVRETVEEILDETNPNQEAVASSSNAPAEKPEPVEDTVHLATKDAWASP